MASDYVPPRREEPIFRPSSNIPWGRWIVRGVILAALLGGTWGLVEGKISLGKYLVNLPMTSKPPSAKGSAKEEEPPKRDAVSSPSLFILSEPSGAKVFVGGVEVGVTPWGGDNVWPEQPLKIEVRMAGYKPWVGTAMGGKQATLRAELKRR